MMKLHFEMIYKNQSKREDGNEINDFSFEMENYNNIEVPKNVNEPIKNLNFV
jgi:hypothetical protein